LSRVDSPAKGWQQPVIVFMPQRREDMNVAVLYAASIKTQQSSVSQESVRQQRVALGVYLALIALHCAWVLSMPVFPSQDGPLHLYYVNVFRELLRHAHGDYSHTYYIGRFIPAYSLYYYGLIALGSIFSLQMADKVIVCIFFVVFGLGVRRLMQVVSGSAVWAPLLVLPMLLNWPLMMGFVNYTLAIGLACFALAIWCRNIDQPGLLPRVRFLLVLGAVILTHPVPWILVTAYVVFDLMVRAARFGLQRRGSIRELFTTAFQLDLFAAVIACLGVFFLLSFRNLQGLAVHAAPQEGPFLSALVARLPGYRHLYGIVLFVDGTTPSHLHRLLFLPAILIMVALALRSLIRAWSTHDSSSRFTWALFALGFLLVFPLIPSNLNGSYFFSMRLMFPIYTCLAVAAAGELTSRRLALPITAAFAALSLFTLTLAQKHIAPAAHEIADLQSAPSVLTARPGLIAWPQEMTTGPLAFNPLLWAGAGYMRQQHGVLYNTPWLELAIIPIKVRPQALVGLDETFTVLPPRITQNHPSLFDTPALQAKTLGRIGYVVGVHEHGVPGVDLLTSAPTPTAGWACNQTAAWQVCTQR
jgi:hypothetical protein